MNIDKIRTKWDNIVKIGLVALAALIISPVIFMIVKGIVGLVIAGVIGLLVVNLAPVVSMKVANWKVKGIVAEAKENPIETMVNLLAAKKSAYAEFRTSVETAVTARSDFEQKCRMFAKQYPARAEEFNKQLQAMTQLVERKKEALRDAKAMLETGEQKLEEMRAYWSMSQAAQKANKAAGMDTGDLYEKLKSDTSVDAVFESMNKAFAQLEVAATLDALPAPDVQFSSNVLNVQAKVLA